MRKLLVFIGLVFTAFFGRAQVHIDSVHADVVWASEPLYFIDNGGGLRYAQIDTVAFNHNGSDALKALLNLNSMRSVWVKFDVVFLKEPQETFSVRTYGYSRVRCYLRRKGVVDSVDVGLADIGHYRHQESDPMAVPIPGDGGDTVTVAFKISHTMRSAMISNLGFEIEPSSVWDTYHKDGIERSLSSGYFFIFFCGLLIFQSFYVLFQWLLVRRREYVYYAAYLTAVFIYYYGRFSVYYSEIPSFSLISAGLMISYNDILLLLPSFFYFRFARHFVDISTYDPSLNLKFKRVEWALLALIFVVIFLRIIPNDINKGLPVFVALGLQLVFSVYAMYRLYQQRRTLANFLIVGSGFALLSHILANVMPFAFPSLMYFVAPITLTMYGILIEIAIFNTGLLYKARGAERDKVKVQAAYISELQRREKLQKEYANVRDKIASDLHDDIGSSLSSINIYSYAADERLARGDIDKTQDLLKSIGRSAGETLNSMGDLVWVINPANDSTAKLVERVKSFAFEILSACECSFQMDVDEYFYDLTLNQEQRKNILLILKEAINNAAKYAEASMVRCRIFRDADGLFTIVLSDNGIGMTADLVPGNGLHTMRKRAAMLSAHFEVASDKNGTTVSFKINVP